jgi:hypothetical protein
VADNWHAIYPDEYEEAHAVAAGAMVGVFIARTGHAVPWRDPMNEAFRRATEEAFNAGVEAARKDPIAFEIGGSRG